jgi:predicted glycosyltransferase
MSDFWVDIDNPPQAQYLSPIAKALRERGHSVFLTARDHQPTLEVLANRNETALPVVGTFGTSKASKAIGTISRAARLACLVRRRIGRPAGVISTARSGVLAARALGAQAFTVLDYEGVELGVFRRSGTIILHPSVIPRETFIERGFPAKRLCAFLGLKEDLAFSGIDVDTVEPATLPPPRDISLAGVLVRPPSETSHYRARDTARTLTDVLDHLSQRDDVQVILLPREPSQARLLTARRWAIPPVLVERQIPPLPLYRAVNRVITGGGTMLREAAWLGLPAISVFQGQLPAVDHWLESQGVIYRVTDARQLDSALRQGPLVSTHLARHPDAMDFVVERILNHDAARAAS